MSTLLPRRVLRTTAWTLLAVWLFAVAAGVANACLLEDSRAHGHASMSKGTASDAGEVSAGHRVALAADADHDEHLAAKAPCLKVCDETPQSPVNKQASSPQFDAPGLAETLCNPWHPSAVLAHSAIAGAATVQAHPTGPPVRVIYSRLVL